MATRPYLTALRFANAGFGIDTSVLTTPMIASTLRRATTMVNTWCNAGDLPQPFDFRGGTITGEQHIFPIPSPLVQFPGSRRVFVHNRPLRTVNAFSIQFTSTYEIVLNPATDVYVNGTEGWCEIIASQPTIIGFPPIGYWYGLYQPIVSIGYDYGYRAAVTDDPCEALSPAKFIASYGMWDAGSDINVYVDGVLQASGYTTNVWDGTVTFTSAPAAGSEVTVDYTATLPDAVAQATGIIAVDLIAQSRIAARGMVGLQSLKVAEIAITQMTANTSTDYVTRNGIRIPAAAAALLGSYALGRAA